MVTTDASIVKGIPSMDASQPHRTVLGHELAELETQLLRMSTLADSMVGRAVESLVNLDTKLAHEVLASDDELDELDLEIEQRCLKLLALQQPMATDLREIGTIMKVITDVERVGDLSVDIAKVGMKIEGELGSSSFIDIVPIGNLARQLFRSSLSAFVKRDMGIVAQVIAEDDQVDQMYRTLRNQLFQHMQKHPEDVVSAGWLLLAVHHLERVADHSVNIAERVAFLITGQFEQLAHSHRPTSAPE